MGRNNKLTIEEKEYIKNNYNKYTVRELAKQINRSEATISRVANELGMSKQIHKSWTDDEENYLFNNYLSMTAEELAKNLNRGVVSVRAHLQDLGLIKGTKWTQEEEKYLTDNYQNMDYFSIGKVLNKTDGVIRAKCNDLNLVKLDRWSKEDEEILKSVYYKMKTKDIAKLLNRTHNAITIHARKLGLKKYPYFCNYRFFKEIDTEEKAYWLGFMSADGWISRRKDTESAAVGVEIQYADINHLKKLNKSLEGNYKITDRWKPASFPSYKDPNKLFHMCAIRIYSMDMYNDLVMHGFSNNKSNYFKIPETIPKELMRHYLRGYFDGDGCFGFTKTHLSCSFLSGNKQIICDIEKILHNEGINPTHLSYIDRDGCLPQWRLYINQGKDKNIIKFLNYIYKDATVYLDRKYNKYVKVLQHYNERLPLQLEMTGSF